MEKIGKTRLERFLEFQRAPATRTTYRGGLKKFFATTYPDLPLEEAVEQYFDEGRGDEDYERDVQGFINDLNERNLVAGSIRTHVAAVRAFLEDNRVILTGAFWRRMSRKMQGGKVTIDRIPTDEELVRILEHLPLRGRALFHLLATSGIRIGSALRLRIEDVHLNADHVQLMVRAPREKKRKSFIAFASEQTKELLEEWYRVRADYLASAVNRSRAYEKDADDDRVFPMHQRTATRLWRKALEDADLGERDPNTNWYVLHPHTLRARVRTKMIDAGVPSEFAHILIGQRSYLDSYVKPGVPKLLEQYKKAEPFLVPSGVVRTVRELDERMQRENADLQFQVGILTRELTRLTAENENLQKNVNAILALGEKMKPKERFDASVGEEEKAKLGKLKKKVLQ